MLDGFPSLDLISAWARHMAALAATRQVLESLAIQLAAIAAMVLVAWGLRAATRSWTAQLVQLYQRRFPTSRLAAVLDAQMPLLYAWLLLAVAARVGSGWNGGWRMVGIAADLTALWLVLRVSTALLQNALVARFIATIAWIIVALDLLGLMAPTESALDSMAITIGALRLSVLLVAKAAVIVALLLWGATALSRLISIRLQSVGGLSRSVQLLVGNLIRISLICIALLVGLNTVGIDLTAFTVFSGAIGVGVGFGLQKIVSNFVSGIILLVERSIKPGDVIEIGKTFGYVASLGARYTAVRGRDGKEYLIPNESLITNQVINWSYSNPLVRVDAEFGVAYASDLRQVRALAIDAAKQTARVLQEPAPVCHITGFGDSAVNLILRFWIEDPERGVTNIKGDVFLAVWEAFKQNEIELPFPQRDLHLRTAPADAAIRDALAAK
ncbi:MAG TPA: mechanosensitive ion channel domain-containing protein [Stellaceae bacterium]|nr:mechanosensitive ion channel domain-containing protein [Stellaceae bacterium]